MIRALTRAIAALAFAVPASAQDFPTRPVRFIVPFSTGGATDSLARQVARKLGDGWGQPVVMENRQGASGNIGMEILAKATPDGYTVAIVNSSLAINPSIFRQISFDIQKDFAHVALLGITPLILVAHPSVNVTSIREFTDLARANPGKYSYGSCGNGTPQHFAGELYRSLANVNIVHVPYKGCAPALTDVLGGQVTFAMLNGSLAAPHMKAGVPKRIIDKIFADTMNAMKDSELRARLQSAGVEEMLGSGAEMVKLFAADIPKYAALVKQANIKVD